MERGHRLEWEDTESKRGNEYENESEESPDSIDQFWYLREIDMDDVFDNAGEKPKRRTNEEEIEIKCCLAHKFFHPSPNREKPHTVVENRTKNKDIFCYDESYFCIERRCRSESERDFLE